MSKRKEYLQDPAGEDKPWVQDKEPVLQDVNPSLQDKEPEETFLDEPVHISEPTMEEE